MRVSLTRAARILPLTETPTCRFPPVHDPTAGPRRWRGPLRASLLDRPRQTPSWLASPPVPRSTSTASSGRTHDEFTGATVGVSAQAFLEEVRALGPARSRPAASSPSTSIPPAGTPSTARPSTASQPASLPQDREHPGPVRLGRDRDRHGLRRGQDEPQRALHDPRPLDDRLRQRRRPGAGPGHARPAQGRDGYRLCRPERQHGRGRHRGRHVGHDLVHRRRGQGRRVGGRGPGAGRPTTPSTAST